MFVKPNLEVSSNPLINKVTACVESNSYNSLNAGTAIPATSAKSLRLAPPTAIASDSSDINLTIAVAPACDG